MSIEEYMNTYRSMEVSECMWQCEEHSTSWDEYRHDYPSSGLSGMVDVKQFFGWLGY